MSTPKIVVVLKEGHIRDVISDTDVELLIIDCNIEGIEEEKIKHFTDLDGEEFRAYAYTDKPFVTEYETSEYFNQYHEG